MKDKYNLETMLLILVILLYLLLIECDLKPEGLMGHCFKNFSMQVANLFNY